MRIKNFLHTSASFIKKYYSHPVYIFSYAFYYFIPTYSAHFTSFTSEELVEEIKNGKSFIRFGDGEVHILNGGGIHYQTYDHNLEKSFRMSIQSYTSNSKYVIGLPYFINMTNSELRSIGQLRTWMPFKVMYTILFPKKPVYADAHFFYYDHYFEKYLESYLLTRHIIVITKEETITSLKNNPKLPFKNISYISAPVFNSYTSCEELHSQVAHVLKSLPEGVTPALLVAIGPASKSFIFELTQKDIQAIDIGVGIEYMYQTEESLERKFPVLHKITYSPYI